MKRSRLNCLSRADEALRSQLGPLKSLSPDGRCATSLAVLGEQVLGRLEQPAAESTATALSRIALAQLRNFPENIFWDFDYTASCLGGMAQRAPAEVTRVADLVVSLQDLFGPSTTINFRYGHDFIYGFDWAKWVSRDPAARAGVGPLDLTFLEYMKQRGNELLKLIERGDAKYPSLEQGAKRNPFGFSREPNAEVVLHRSLAEDGLIPVEGWRVGAVPRWQRNFSRLRSERAAQLGLSDPMKSAANDED